MCEYVYGHDQIVGDFVAGLIPHCWRGFGDNIKAIGVLSERGSLIAGLVYHNYDPEAGVIEISGAALPGAHWLTRETIKRMYTYPFHICGCQMVVQRTPSDDERLLYMLARYGYNFVTVERLFGRNRDGVVCTLTREAWEGNRYNRRLKHHLATPPLQEEAA
jgi:RimJ/RimL family protein N-acetyltransferase